MWYKIEDDQWIELSKVGRIRIIGNHWVNGGYVDHSLHVVIDGTEFNVFSHRDRDIVRNKIFDMISVVDDNAADSGLKPSL